MSDDVIVAASGLLLSILIGFGGFRRWQRKTLAALQPLRQACRERFGFLEVLGFEEKPELCSSTWEQDGIRALLVTYEGESVVMQVIRTLRPSQLLIVLIRPTAGPFPDRSIEIESLLAVEAPAKTLRDRFGMQRNLPMDQRLDFYAQALQEHGTKILGGDQLAFAAVEDYDNAAYESATAG